MEVVNFKAYCANQGLKPQEVADILGIGVSSVRSYMNGSRTPLPRVMNLMEQKLGMTPEMLYKFFIKDKE